MAEMVNLNKHLVDLQAELESLEAELRDQIERMEYLMKAHTAHGHDDMAEVIKEETKICEARISELEEMLSIKKKMYMEVGNTLFEEMGFIQKMGIEDMEMAAATISRQPNAVNEPSETANVTTKIQASALGLTSKVEAHESNMNYSLLEAAYVTMKGNFPAPAWRENENEILQQKSPIGNTVLHMAAMYGNDEWVEKVARKAPHLLVAKNSNGDTALHVAAKAGHVSTIKKLLSTYLITEGLKYSQEVLDKIVVGNDQGNSFLHEALLNGHKGVMNFLESEEFDPEFRKLVQRTLLCWINNENKSILYLAIEAGYKDVVDKALAILNTLNPNYVPDGKSPLLAAIRKQGQDILDIILKRMPEWIHVKDMEGRTPLHYAASIGYLKGVQYLLGKCISCTMERDKFGFFPLHLASDGGHVEVVKMLLQHCLDPKEMLDKSGRNILHIAVESGKLNMVKYILQINDPELEKMINGKDANGNTPLHLATLCSHPKIVHVLTWDKRVDPTLVNRNSQTALDACGQFPQANPSLRQRLTWIALRSAGVQYANTHSGSIKDPTKSTESFWNQNAPNMEPYKDRINTLMLVSTLIITVTFAAGFTLPGGTNGSDPGQGMALMLNRVWFKLFIFCITISMYGAISVTIILIWAQVGDITLALLAFKVARPLLGITLATLSVAFLAGIYLVISDLN